MLDVNVRQDITESIVNLKIIVNQIRAMLVNALVKGVVSCVIALQAIADVNVKMPIHVIQILATMVNV